ncbi:MAG: hypothetical protein GPJ13_21910 [Microcystis aeruginosa W11-06]|nr:hypothetical protein [Microcystis aeruginosa W11-03]NCR96216.1 hypothetical protein [Microcystis aeruginosa W11-06]
MASLAKKTFGYQERNEEKRQKFGEEISQLHDKDLVYIDEAGMDNRDNYE